ncbi:MAG: helix-turn-helix domain-containing protein [Nanoarchaeota archaeon]
MRRPPYFPCISLDDFLTSFFADQTLTPDNILERACAATGIKKDNLLSEDRTTPLANLRHAIAYVLRYQFSLTCRSIATFLGRRDHTTVLSSLKQIDPYARHLRLPPYSPSGAGLSAHTYPTWEVHYIEYHDSVSP